MNRRLLFPLLALGLLFVLPAFGVGVGDASGDEDATGVGSNALRPLLAAEKATRQAAVKYVEQFYKSLELTREENQRAYEEGSGFDRSALRAYLNDRSRYSRKRLENLTGMYHYHFNVELLRTDSVVVGSDEVVLETTVEYWVYEVGGFLNAEKITLSRTSSGFVVRRWDDLRLIEKQLAEYDGLENFGAANFYETLGSLNKGK